MLQARFAIVRGFARFFHLEILQKIMKACIILHNIIVEDERDDNEVVDLDYEQIDGMDNPPTQVLREQSDGFMSYIKSGSGRVGGIGGGRVGGSSGGRNGRVGGGGSNCSGGGGGHNSGCDGCDCCLL
ncbi:hypothetical protein SO802_013143 [Lithocarpus litseifolius]|uniref:Uncharacterized protein n=1 Tax=Lithocarpus litseifolius TaxID=425828 RepID=A0AAW2D719_9ROSI